MAKTDIDPMDMPLKPSPGYLVGELIVIKFFHPITLPDGTETALEGTGEQTTPIMRVVAVGLGVEGWEVGEYFVNHPNNTDLSWHWKNSPLPLQVIKAENICTKLDTAAVEEQLRLMSKYDTPLQEPTSGDLGLRVKGPSEKRILFPGDVDLIPEL